MPSSATSSSPIRAFGRTDGRWIVVILVPLCAWLFFALSAQWDVVRIARTWGIYSIEPKFSDLYVAPAAVRTLEAGGNPYRENPFDPLQRRMNYPPIWLKFSGTDMSPDHIRIQAIVMSSLCLLALLAYWGPLTLRAGLFIALLGCSPPVLLALERANTDLLVLTLLAVSLCLLRSAPQRLRLALGWLLLIAASFLKLFPMVAFVVVLKEKGPRFWFLVSVAAVACIGCLLLNASTLPLLMANTPNGGLHSYGAKGPAFWATFFLSDRGWSIDRDRLALMGIACAALIVVIAFRFALRLAKPIAAEATSPHLDGFRVGAAIYIATFLLGSNFDYRLLFLLLCLPELFARARETSALQHWPLAGLILIFATLWPNGLRWAPLIAVKEIASWSLVFVLSVIFFRLLPDRNRRSLASA